jgi:hypothetical protein
VAQVARVFLDRLEGAPGVCETAGAGETAGGGEAADGAGLTRSELQREVDALAGRLRAGGASVHLPRQDQDYAVEAGLRMLTLRNLVVADGGLYRPNPEERTLLAYYANSIAHLPGAAERPRQVARSIPG